MCQSNAFDGIGINGNVFIKLFAKNSLGSAGDFPDFRLKSKKQFSETFWSLIFKLIILMLCQIKTSKISVSEIGLNVQGQTF